MSSLIPSLKLFPIYKNGPILDGRYGLNADSSFVIPGTRYRSTYAVNVTPDSDPYDPNYYLDLTANPAHRLVSKPIADATEYTTLLSLNNRVPGHIGTATAPATAPDIPNAFKQRASFFTVTDTNFATLMAQPSFRIEGIGLGLLVTTDGHGGVLSEEIDPGMLGAIRRADAVGHSLGSPNRADISIKAVFKVNDPGFSFGDVYAVEAPNGPRKTPPTKNLPGPPAGLNATGSLKNAGIFKSDDLTGATSIGLPGADGGLNGSNSVQALLNQLQPPDTGLGVSGADADLGLEQAQQVALHQADYGINLSSNYYQQLASVVSAAELQRQNSYAATHAPSMDRVMDGRVNVYLVEVSRSVNGGPATDDLMWGVSMGSAVADATTSNGKKGYIPFNMQQGETPAGSGGPSSGGTGGSTNPNPFASRSGGFQGGSTSGGNEGGQSGYKARLPKKIFH